MKKPILLLTGIFILFLIAIVVLADRGALPGWITLLYNFPYGDKVGHFLLMGLLAFLVNLSLSRRKVRILSRPVLLGSLIVTVLVTLEELSQGLFASRSASLGDLGASYLGIAFFSYLAGTR